MGYFDLVFFNIGFSKTNRYIIQQHIHKKSHQDSGDTQGIYKKEKLFLLEILPLLYFHL